MTTELSFKNVLAGDYELAYKIDDGVSKHYEALTSFERGRDYNQPIRAYVEQFVDEFKGYLTSDNKKALNERLMAYNKLVVELKTSVFVANKTPSMMLTGAANYPTVRKQKENDHIHQLEGELYSDTGKRQRFIENTDKMFNPYLIRRKKEVEAKRQKRSSENGWETFFTAVDHDEIAGYGIDKENSRIYIKTNDKPEPETRALFKKAALRWSPRNQRWQRVLTQNAIYAIKQRVFEPLAIECEDI